MRDWDDGLAGARVYVRPAWTEGREDRTHERVRVRAARQRHFIAVALVVAPVLCAAVGLFAWHHHAASPHAAPSAAVATTAKPEARRTLLSLSDGSMALGISDDARVEPLEVTPDRVVVRLVRGSARFEVTPLAHREFTVQTDLVEVTVLGTIFVVDAEPSGVDVRVERGRVRAESAAVSRVLGVGQHFFFDARSAAPPASAALQGDGASAAPVNSAPATSAPRPVTPREAADWRALAQAGNYDEAYAALKRSGAAAVHDEPGDLMLAADVARLGGQHGSDAVTFLRRVVDRHPSDSRASLAAFTLGRVLLDQLGQPVQAATAFASARRLAPGGALAQDALAREVESWDRAGDAARARDRAEEYLRLFPNGQRRNAVRRFGGLD